MLLDTIQHYRCSIKVFTVSTPQRQAAFAGNALNSVIERENVNSLSVRNFSAGRNGDEIRNADAQVLADALVHTDVAVVTGLVGEDDADRVAALLSLDQHSVTAEKLEFLHFGRAQGNDRIVVVGCVVHNQTIGGPLLSHSRVFHFFVADLRKQGSVRRKTGYRVKSRTQARTAALDTTWLERSSAASLPLFHSTYAMVAQTKLQKRDTKASPHKPIQTNTMV